MNFWRWFGVRWRQKICGFCNFRFVTDGLIASVKKRLCAHSLLSSRNAIGFFLLRHFGHLYHSSIKTHRNTIFISLYFWPNWLNFFGHLKKILVYDRKKPRMQLQGSRGLWDQRKLCFVRRIFVRACSAPVCGGVSTDLQLQPLLQLSEPESSSKIEAETRRDLDCVTAPNRHIALVAVVERRELEQREASFSFSVTLVYAIQMEK